MHRVEDWAGVPPAEMAPLYRLEAARWRAELDWDTADTWDALERARRDGRVPGLVVRRPHGVVAGWTYFLLQGTELQIGALVSTDADMAAALLDGVLGSPAAMVAGRALFFAYTSAPGVADVMAQRGFEVGAEHYMVRALDASPRPASAVLRAWLHDDLEAVADLLQAAYRGADPRRAFAPSGTLVDWRDYVRLLTLTTGCGTFLPLLSVVSQGPCGALDGAALVTRVSETSAHLAQLAVRPGARGTGLGAVLLGHATDLAAASGFARLSLLVSETNGRARLLYADHGFAVHRAFMSATRSRERPARRATAPAA